MNLIIIPMNAVDLPVKSLQNNFPREEKSTAGLVSVQNFSIFASPSPKAGPDELKRQLKMTPD